MPEEPAQPEPRSRAGVVPATRPVPAPPALPAFPCPALPCAAGGACGRRARLGHGAAALFAAAGAGAPRVPPAGERCAGPGPGPGLRRARGR